ncbi:uncharacterized protein TNCV_3310231 [Trichonephila clavipes]|nr:uncharacterized protein TNCV_3310231 [Trichonephila clavipes]
MVWLGLSKRPWSRTRPRRCRVTSSGSDLSEDLCQLCNLTAIQNYEIRHQWLQAVVAEWYRYRIKAGFVTSSSLVPLKTRRVWQRCTLNLSRAETSSRWCGVVVRRGGVPAQVSSTSLDHGS